MKTILFFSLICVLGLTDCGSENKNNKINNPPHEITDTNLCSLAEKNLKLHHCKEGEPTKTGKTFTEVCNNAQAHNIWFNPSCLSQINDCQEITTVCGVEQ